MSTATRKPICMPDVVLNPRGMTMRQRIELCSELRARLRRIEIARSFQSNGTLEGGLSCYDYCSLHMLAVAAEHNFIKPWFLPRLEVEVTVHPERIIH